MLRKFTSILFIYLFVFPLIVNAQEFTIKKTPEQIQHEKDIKEEVNYLKFQDHFFAALVQKSKEDYQKAIEELEECKQIYPNDPGLNFEFAKNYLLLKDYENAIYFDEKTLESKPKNSNILAHLKKVYKSKRDFESAITVQKRIIAINPAKKTDLIPLYYQNRQREKAKQLFLELENNHAVIANESFYKRMLFPQKEVQAKTSNKEIAINDAISNNSIQQLQDKFKKNKDYKTLKTLLLEEEKQAKYNLIQKDSKKGLALFPAQPFLYFMQGKSENNLRNYQNAIEALKAGLDYIIDDKPLEINIYTQIAKAYSGLGKTQEATKYLEKAKQLKK